MNISGIPSCVQKCPAGYYADNSTQSCVSSCPLNPLSYGANISNSGGVCLSSCLSGTYGDNDTRLCLNSCIFSLANPIKITYADDSTQFCVYICPPGSYTSNATFTNGISNNDGKCSNKCLTGQFADNSTWKCVYVCPSSPILYADSSTGTC